MGNIQHQHASSDVSSSEEKGEIKNTESVHKQAVFKQGPDIWPKVQFLLRYLGLPWATTLCLNGNCCLELSRIFHKRSGSHCKLLSLCPDAGLSWFNMIKFRLLCPVLSSSPDERIAENLVQKISLLTFFQMWKLWSWLFRSCWPEETQVQCD